MLIYKFYFIKMNADSITRLTAGLFDGIKDMKDAKNYSNDLYIKPDDYKKGNFEKSDTNDLSLSEKKLYEYPAELIKEYSEKEDDEFEDAEERELDKQFKKNKYELLPEVKNPLKNFYNEVINEDVLKYVRPDKKNKYIKRKNKANSTIFEKDYDKLVNKVNKKVYKWIEDFDIFNYIIKSGKKYKVATSKSKMDISKKPTLEKLKYVDKLIRKGKFTEQVIKKFVERHNITPKNISVKEIDTMIKPFYEKCLIKAFERKIKYTRRG